MKISVPHGSMLQARNAAVLYKCAQLDWVAGSPVSGLKSILRH